MSINDIGMLFKFVGGIGMFLYGMNVMGDGIQRSAGGKMSKLLGILTSNRLLAVGVGTLVTAIIQSSGATTVMVVGFVNGGILTLTQAVGVIMGANIGTTITAWVVSLGEFGDKVAVLKPSFLAPLIIAVGVVLFMFAKGQKKKLVGEICIGLGLLFTGLDLISDSVSGYTNMPIFSKAFSVLGNNPFLGILAGILVTTLLQSSSASIGIMQSLARSGMVTTNAAVFLTLGQNIGACTTALLSSTGANRAGKRAAVINLLFNIAGTIIFGILIFIYFEFFNPSLAAKPIGVVSIAVFHTFYNVAKTLIQLPFADGLVKMSGLIVKERQEEKNEDTVESIIEEFKESLDARILRSATFAVDTVLKKVTEMGRLTSRNVEDGVQAIFTGDAKLIDKVFKMETVIDKLETLLTEYLVKINNLSLTEQQHMIINNLFYTVSDIERVGDHAENLAELAKYMKDNELDFSSTGREDLQEISRKVVEGFNACIDARENNDILSVRKVAQYEDCVDSLEEELREKHIVRLSQKECQPPAGVVFLDIISNLERISDHAYNIAGYVKDEM